MHWAYITTIFIVLIDLNCLGRAIGCDNVWAKNLGAMLDPQFKEGLGVFLDP